MIGDGEHGAMWNEGGKDEMKESIESIQGDT